MLRRLLIFLAIVVAPALAHAQNIRPHLVAEKPASPGREVEIAIHMRPAAGWHGYWLNPGDAGLPMAIEWDLPAGVSVGPLRYPVPARLKIAGLMNYVYEQDYALLTRLEVPRGARGTIPIRARARRLACTDKICVPEQGEFELDLPVGGASARDPRFDQWRRALPRPLTSAGKFGGNGDKLRVSVPLPADVAVREPYVYPATEGVVEYNADQQFWRTDSTLIAELDRRPGPVPQRFSGVLAIGDGRGLAFEALPGSVPDGGTPIGDFGAEAVFWAVLGAIAGGILLNLMPCVFPILALKALHLARAGADEREARAQAISYAAGAVAGTAALGLALLALRSGGSAVGWAFQLQDSRTIMLLLLLATAITVNLLGFYRLPVMAANARPAGSFGTGALAAFVATPCAGPFLGAALGAALLLPPSGSVLVFAALGLGLAVPFLIIAFVPRLRDKMPRPGRWTERLQRFLAIPMAATAVACLWLLYRQAGQAGLIAGIAAAALISVLLAGWGFVQRRGLAAGWAAAIVAGGVTGLAIWQVPSPSAAVASDIAGAERWNPARTASYVARGYPVFVYFTADWCLTCKVNEASAIRRDSVQAAFKARGVKVLAGDWTNGDPAITRFLESRGRSGVPLYLWYQPGRTPEELPQILTPSMLTSRARRVR